MTKSGLQVFIKTIPALSEDVEWQIPSEKYCLVVILDSEDIPKDIQHAGSFATSALRSGAQLIICCGSAGELMHDIFDEVIAADYATANSISRLRSEVLTINLSSLSLIEAFNEVFEVHMLPDLHGTMVMPIVFVLIKGDPRINKLSDLLKD